MRTGLFDLDSHWGVEMEELDEDPDTPFVPRSLLTRNGLVEIKPHYETICGLEPAGENILPESYHEIPETPTSEPSRSKKFELNFEGSMLEGEDLERLKSIVGKFPNVFATHAEDIGKTTLMHHYVTLTSEKPVSANYY